eukprot:contig_15537_g3711
MPDVAHNGGLRRWRHARTSFSNSRRKNTTAPPAHTNPGSACLILPHHVAAAPPPQHLLMATAARLKRLWCAWRRAVRIPAAVARTAKAASTTTDAAAGALAEGRAELAAWPHLLVAIAATTTSPATGPRRPTRTWRATHPTRRTGRLLQGSGDDLRRQVQVAPQVLNALVRQEVVIVAPRELLLHVAARHKRLHQLDHVQVGHILQVNVLLGTKILLGHHHAILEELGIHSQAVLFRDEHDADGRSAREPRALWRRRGKTGERRQHSRRDAEGVPEAGKMVPLATTTAGVEWGQSIVGAAMATELHTRTPLVNRPIGVKNSIEVIRR